MVVIKLVVNEPSEKRKSRQLFPTPTKYSVYINQPKTQLTKPCILNRRTAFSNSSQLVYTTLQMPNFKLIDHSQIRPFSSITSRIRKRKRQYHAAKQKYDVLGVLYMLYI